VQLP
jgi:hypothetical protein